MTEKTWAEMTPQEKREQRLKGWLNNWGNKFPDADAEKAYKTRVQRLIDVYNVKEPDRVPVNLPVGNLPLIMFGINAHTAMYDPEKALKAAQAFNEKYGAELEYAAGLYYPRVTFWIYSIINSMPGRDTVSPKTVPRGNSLRVNT